MNLSDLNQQQYQQHAIGDAIRLLSIATRRRTSAPGAVADAFLEAYPRAVHADLVRKAAVLPGTTSDASWAGSLVPSKLVDAFLPLLRGASVLSTLPYQPVPFQTPVPRQTADGSFAWVGENLPKPATKFAFDSVKLVPAKAAGVVVVTSELMLLTQPGSIPAIQRAMVNGVTKFVDAQLLGSGAPAGGPKGLLNGVTPVTATADLAKDLGSLVSAFFTAAPDASNPWFVVSPAVKGKIAALEVGTNLRETGGTLLSYPVAVSPGAGTNAILLDVDQLLVADAGASIDVSSEATIEMVDNPAAPTASTVVVSLWQADLAGILVERVINWTMKTGSIQYVAVA